LTSHPASELQLVRDWVKGYLLTAGGRSRQAEEARSDNLKSQISDPQSKTDQGRSRPEESVAASGKFRHLDEVSALLFCGDALKKLVVEAGSRARIEGLKGSHGRIDGSTYVFDYLDFQRRLSGFEREVVPRYQKYHQLKQQLVEQERDKLRLDEFKPRVLSSFVRNQLIDRVYLPMIGDNLAKQVGSAGAGKRTELMGLLLLITPPGYGKTTLMDYIANRLGIVFVKVNGPALGHNVMSLDPEEAPNAAAPGSTSSSSTTASSASHPRRWPRSCTPPSTRPVKIPASCAFSTWAPETA
jgi:ATP-dependent Lon protease